MTRRPWWTVMCPVCGEELPERGNKRVYVPWKRGWKLVHAEDCAGLIEAQSVLDVAPRKPKPVDPVTLVRARARVQALLERDDPVKHSREELTAIAGLRVAGLMEPFVRDIGPEELKQLYKHAWDRVIHAGSIRPKPDGLLA